MPVPAWGWPASLAAACGTRAAGTGQSPWFKPCLHHTTGLLVPPLSAKQP